MLITLDTTKAFDHPQWNLTLNSCACTLTIHAPCVDSLPFHTHPLILQDRLPVQHVELAHCKSRIVHITCPDKHVSSYFVHNRGLEALALGYFDFAKNELQVEGGCFVPEQMLQLCLVEIHHETVCYVSHLTIEAGIEHSIVSV